MGLARVAALVGVCGALISSGRPALSDSARAVRVELWADRDDDDADGCPDGEQLLLTAPTYVDLVPIDARMAGAPVQLVA